MSETNQDRAPAPALEIDAQAADFLARRANESRWTEKTQRSLKHGCPLRLLIRQHFGGWNPYGSAPTGLMPCANYITAMISGLRISM